ncbi:40S ribosomal protein S13 [Tanacetum coccineum]
MRALPTRKEHEPVFESCWFNGLSAYMMQTRSRTRSSLAKEDADKLAKKGSASSQSDYQKIDTVTRSKAPMMAPKLEIPQTLYVCINAALKAERELERLPNDEALLKTLSIFKRHIGSLAEIYKDTGRLPSDWEYHPDTASSCVPNKSPLVFGNPHIDIAPLVVEWAKAVRLNLKLKKADKVAEERSASSQSDYQKIDRVTPSKDSCIMQTRSRSSLAWEAAYKLAKKGSASSQSDYQKIDRVTRSKAPMIAPKLKIPETLYICINQALEAEQKLKTHTSDKVLKQLELAKKRIGSLADFYKHTGHLPSDWE